MHRLADLLGHDVTMDSWPGRGSAFRVIVARGESADVHEENEPAAPVRVATERLLVARGCVPLFAPDAKTAAVPAVIVLGESHADELERILASGYLLLHKPVAPARLRSALAWLLSDAHRPA